MMALQANMTTRPCLSSPVAARRSAASPARFSQLTARREVAVRGLPSPEDLIGRVNNPEETRENAERKQEEGEWAKPRPNKNPLEKTGAAHGIGQGGIATPDGEDPTDEISEKAKAGVDSVVGGLKDAAKKVTGNDN
jgi:hypothetical protein